MSGNMVSVNFFVKNSFTIFFNIFQNYGSITIIFYKIGAKKIALLW